METPITDHLSAKDYEHVYEPAEDSFLMLDALEADLPYLQHLNPVVCLEIGAGSGLVITALANKFRHTICLASDINAHACLATTNTAQRNSAQIDVIQCNLADALQLHKVDVLVFNPPYVVTADEEIGEQSSANLSHAWAGGLDGRRIIDELVKRLDGILSAQGVLYLLLLRENKPEQLREQFKTMNFKSCILMERRIPGEYLYILKVSR